MSWETNSVTPWLEKRLNRRSRKARSERAEKAGPRWGKTVSSRALLARCRILMGHLMMLAVRLIMLRKVREEMQHEAAENQRVLCMAENSSLRTP